MKTDKQTALEQKLTALRDFIDDAVKNEWSTIGDKELEKLCDSVEEAWPGVFSKDYSSETTGSIVLVSVGFMLGWVGLLMYFNFFGFPCS